MCKDLHGCEALAGTRHGLITMMSKKGSAFTEEKKNFSYPSFGIFGRKN